MATKREAIREGIINNLNEFRQELQKPGAIINIDTLVILQSAFADKILKDEDSQGVVLKVADTSQDTMGFYHPDIVQVVPLIEKYPEPTFNVKETESLIGE